MTRRRLGTAAISTVIFAVMVAALCVATEFAARHEHMFATRRDRVIADAVEPLLLPSPPRWSPPTPSAQIEQPPPAPVPVKMQAPAPPALLRRLPDADSHCWGRGIGARMGDAVCTPWGVKLITDPD